MSRVVRAEESKTGVRFEIGPSYDVVPTRSQLLTDGQSSCRVRITPSRMTGQISMGSKREHRNPSPTLNTPANKKGGCHADVPRENGSDTLLRRGRTGNTKPFII